MGRKDSTLYMITLAAADQIFLRAYVTKTAHVSSCLLYAVEFWLFFFSNFESVGKEIHA